ncbi:MAG: hypothetical protein HY080_04945 [Gammaproteobacteria bacterium]|nr:hypothetical protein [Gammaproteobacteria bacterium]
MGDDYHLVSPVPAPYADLYFVGVFEQKTVIWKARIGTLDYYSHHLPHGVEEKMRLRAFIDIGHADGELRPLSVGLNVPIIDAATIQKTIIMVRQYKRLQLGRYEYGEVYSHAPRINPD